MSSRSSKWVVHEVERNGRVQWDLSRGGRYMYEGLASKAEVLRRLKNHHKAGEPVILEEKDGYRNNITNQLKKAGIVS